MSDRAVTAPPPPPPPPPADAAVATGPGRRPGAVPLLTAGLIVAVAIAATFSVLWLQSREPSAEQVGQFLTSERSEVEKRAVEVIGHLLNYDATSIESVSEQMLEISTGNFREQYEELSGALLSALEESKASSRGEILEPAEISFRTPSEAIAIARVSQVAQSSDIPGGRSIEYVLKITLIDTSDGGWKADRVEVLSETQT